MNNFSPFVFNDFKHRRWIDQSYVRERFSNKRVDAETDDDRTTVRSVSSYALRTLAAEVFQRCERIRSETAYARTTMSSMSAAEFAATIKSMQVLKSETSRRVALVSDPRVYNDLKVKMSKRSSERSRLKRRRKNLMAERNERRKLIEIKLERIEEKLKQTEHAIKKNKMENEVKVKADGVLKDVNKRKSDAHKYISLLENLCKLRGAREKTLLGCGKATCATETDVFLKSIEKLKTLWNDALTRYENEKCELKMILDNDKTSQNENIDDNVVGCWQNIMFGDKSFLSHHFDGDLIKYINMRMQWDKYICFDGKGTRIPIGWLFPVTPTEKWKSFIKFKH